jgi:hypothetical protein
VYDLPRSNRGLGLSPGSWGGGEPRAATARGPAPDRRTISCAESSRLRDRTSSGSPPLPGGRAGEQSLPLGDQGRRRIEQVREQLHQTRLTSELAVAAPCNAVAMSGRPADTIGYSDRGSQFRSHAYRRELRNRRASRLGGAPWGCFDNASTESFSSVLEKNVLGRRRWATHDPTFRPGSAEVGAVPPSSRHPALAPPAEPVTGFGAPSRPTPCRAARTSGSCRSTSWAALRRRQCEVP